jgi:DinB superfamily
MNDKALREHVMNLLSGKGAHADFIEAVKDVPEKLRGLKPKGAPYSAWQLLEHIRIAQWDILEFSRDAKHESPSWPSGYWPKTAEPPSAAAWDKSVAAVKHDREEMIKLVKNPKTDLFAKISHGDGQTILREALLVADHNSYHVGQLILLRRLLGDWEE